MQIKPSKPFSNGTEYELFLENFCYRCKSGKLRADGFPAFPEDGGCPIWDAMENARFDVSLFPSDDIVMIVKEGEIPHWHICKKFKTNDKELMSAFNKLFY